MQLMVVGLLPRRALLLLVLVIIPISLSHSISAVNLLCRRESSTLLQSTARTLLWAVCAPFNNLCLCLRMFLFHGLCDMCALRACLQAMKQTKADEASVCVSALKSKPQAQLDGRRPLTRGLRRLGLSHRDHCMDHAMARPPHVSTSQSTIASTGRSAPDHAVTVQRDPHSLGN